MKHIVNTTLLLLALLLPTNVFAYDFEVDRIYYNINGNEAEVTHKYSDYIEGDSYVGEVNANGEVNILDVDSVIAIILKG